MKKFLLVFLSLILVVSLCACGTKSDKKSADDNTFIMGIDPEYPPFTYIGEDGEYTGFDVDVCKAACELLGYDFKTFAVNWDDKLVQLDSHECDCVWAGLTILDSIKEQGYLLTKPYFDNTQVILTKENSGIKSSKDLKGKMVATLIGSSGEKLLNEDLADLTASFDNLITCESFLKCFAELAGDAVDAVVADYPVAKNFVLENDGYVILDEVLGSEKYGVAFRSDDQALCDAIEGAVAELVENGTYAEIASKYSDIKDNLIFLK